MARPAITERFELEELFARGASGEVWRGRDRSTGERVAVKRLREEHDSFGVVATRLEREAELLGQIDSPFVVRLIDHGRDGDGRPCLVLEWLAGEDLAARLGRSRLSIEDAVSAARQAALGLSALHALGIVHRDVKPSNFFVLEGAGPIRVKLVDLGIARDADRAALTVQGTTIGTPAYMSPEQARGEAVLTPQSDLFSLGAALFEMISGRRAFGGEQPFAVLAKVVLEDPPRLSTLVPGLARELDTLVVRALDKLPQRRPASAAEMARLLAEVATRPAADAPEDERTSRIGAVSGAVESGELRVVTAVFAQFLPGPTMAESMRAFEAIADEHGADAHRTLGGRMIGVLGGERSIGDEAPRAARIALAAQGAIAGARLAIVTGRAVAGVHSIGGEAIERGAVGVEEAREGILVDRATARLLAGQFVVHGPADRGILSGERGTHEPSRTLLGKATRCYGREREIATLALAFRECVEEPMARAVLVVAPAGGGKSRVRFELVRRIEETADPRPLVLLGVGDPMAAGSPLAMIGGAVRRLVGILEGEPAESQRHKIRARLDACVPESERDRVADFLGEVAGVAAAAGQARPIHPDAIGDAMRSAVIDWLHAECARQPVLLVLEDLQWGDAPTVRCLDAALNALRDQPFMVVAAARPEIDEVFRDLWASHSVVRIDLDELRVKACTALIREVLGDTIPEDTVRLVVERSQGNPFFLEELIRAVAEGEARDLPDTVLGVLQARLDALPLEAKRTLRAASVFGRSFWHGGVAALLGGDSAVVRASLARLTLQEVVTSVPQSRFPGEIEYSFRHALVRDAAYASIVDSDRERTHRLAAEWLVAAGESAPMTLAEHFDRGGDAERAVHWLCRAAEQALEGSDFDAAIERAERGAKACADDAMLGALRVTQAAAHRWRAEPLLAQRAAAEALGLLRPGSEAWFQAIREAAAAGGRLGGVEELDVLAARAVDTTPDPDAMSAKVVAIAQAITFLLISGRLDTARGLVERIEHMAKVEQLDPFAERAVRVARGYHAVYAGIAGEAAEVFASIATEQEAAGDVRQAAHSTSLAGFLFGEIGAYERAESMLRKARDTAQRMGVQEIFAGCSHNLGIVVARLGRTDEARALEEHAVRHYREQRETRLEAGSRLYLSMIDQIDGKLENAEEHAAAAAELAGGSDALRAACLAQLALVLVARGRADEALVHAERASELLGATSAAIEHEALPRVALVEALAAAGKREEAKAAAQRALAWLERRASEIGSEAVRTTFLECVPEHVRIRELARELAGSGGS